MPLFDRLRRAAGLPYGMFDNSYSDAEARAHKPSLVYVDDRNRILYRSDERIEDAVLAKAS